MRIEVEMETDGRWIAEAPEIPGVMTYGADIEEAVRRVKVLALRVMEDKAAAEQPV